MSAAVRSWLGTLAFLGFAVATASACTIPVFRFALDRWEADPYRLVVPASWATDREKVKLLVPLRGNAAANIVIEESADPTLDRAILRFPHDEGILWEGALDDAALAPLLDSPLRRELVRRILRGDSVIWIVATTEADRGEVDRVSSRLSFLEQVAQLPVQNPNDPDSQLGPGPALRLGFSVIPLALDDPAERLLATMLAGPEHADFIEGGLSFAAPVFGRGRVLGAWALDALDDLMIEDASLFLTGRCSCRVKKESPGWDLLLKVDWENALAAAPTEIPDPVTAVAAASPPETVAGPPETVVITPSSASVSASASASPTASAASSSIPWPLIGGIALSAGLALAGWRLWRLG